jgi:hypothetical protein
MRIVDGPTGVNLISVNAVATPVRRWQFSSQARLSTRAALCLAIPLIVGLITNQRAYGTLVAGATARRGCSASRSPEARGSPSAR